MYSKSKANARKQWYALGLGLGSLGLILVSFAHNQMLTIIAFILFGIAYFTIHTIPFTLLTSSLNGENEGAYMGLFNIGICLPQIIASLLSFVIFPMTGKSQPMMMLIAGISLAIGALCVHHIHEGVAKK